MDLHLVSLMLDQFPIDRLQLGNPIRNNDWVSFDSVIQQRLLDRIARAGHVAATVEKENAVPPHDRLKKFETRQAERL